MNLSLKREGPYLIVGLPSFERSTQTFLQQQMHGFSQIFFINLMRKSWPPFSQFMIKSWSLPESSSSNALNETEQWAFWTNILIYFFFSLSLLSVVGLVIQNVKYQSCRNSIHGISPIFSRITIITLKWCSYIKRGRR